ncbi:MAG: site-specific integrase [Candidatus Korobacteraceae bacterium]
MEESFNRITKRTQMPLFKVAAGLWLSSKTGLVEKSIFEYRQRLKPVVAEFGGKLVSDITLQDLSEYQATRAAAGLSARTINYEVGCIRGVLKQHGQWAVLADRVRSLRERHDVGRAISTEDEQRLLAACQKSRTPTLLPLFVLSIDTGLRSSEVKALRRKDLTLEWKDGSIQSGQLMVPRSKTEAGTGRTVPLSNRVCAVLTQWIAHFAEASPESYLFPYHRIGLSGNKRATAIYDVQLGSKMGEWKSAWKTAGNTADVDYRWHDLRHTFISRLAENPNVSEGTIRALAGHVSRQMLQRYSHIRTEAKEQAIAALERVRSEDSLANSKPN